MWLILGLIVLGIILLIAEVVLLPGFTVSGVLGFVSFGVAVYLAFMKFGVTGGLIALSIVAALSVIGIVLALRAKTWNRFALNNKIDSQSQEMPQNKIAVGDRGVTMTRLAPRGKISIKGETYEAKAVGDIFVDPKVNVEVVTFENFGVVVKVLE